MTISLKEQVTVNDLLQLIIEGHLPLSWFARRVPARKVELSTLLLSRKLLSGSVKRSSDDPEIWRDILEVAKALGPVEDTDKIKYLKGSFKLEFQYCDALVDWVHSKLTHTGGGHFFLDAFLDGFFVTQSDGTIWQIMEFHLGELDKAIDDEKQEMQETFYRPSSEFPDGAELIIQRRDIEYFENSLVRSQDANLARLSPRAETSLLNIIAALLEVTTKGIPNPDSPGNTIGPASEFKSEAKLIKAIADHYHGYGGLSKSNLERKFPAARRSLN